LGLAALTALAYLPAWRAGIIWNDPDYITRAPLRSLTGLGQIWTKLGATEQYYPLLHSAFWVEFHFWGASALGYHLFNVALHATSVVLLAGLLSALFARKWPTPPGAPAWTEQAAWIGAALFAVHPVMAESVIWISEQKNTLSLVFYLWAARQYLRFAFLNSRRGYWQGLLLFLAALLSKTVTATLGPALLVMLWWAGEPLWPSAKARAAKWQIGWLAPWLLLGAVAGVFSAWVERTYVGASGADFTLNFVERTLLAARIPWFYLGKLFWPADLVFFYPHWTIDAHAVDNWLWLAATAGLTVILAFLARRSRGPLAVWLLFLGGLFPTLGYFNVFAFVYSYVADHWNYLSSLPVFAGAGWALVFLTRRWPAAARGLAAGALIAVLAARTWQEGAPYRDLVRFYTHIIYRNPGAWMAENNLANIEIDAQRYPEAVRYLDASLQARPNAPVQLYNRGLAQHRLDHLAAAQSDLTAALRAEPAFALARLELARVDNDVGAAGLSSGRLQAALDQFLAAVKLDPKLAVAWANIGHTLIAGNRPGAAIRPLEEALLLQSDFPEAENDLGKVFTMLGRPREAIPHFEAALHLRPDYPDAQRNLASARGGQ
jgi:tetratricopeptide (TPR) repeat protein